MIFSQAASGHLLESKAVELSLAAEAESSTRPRGRSWRADDWRAHVGEQEERQKKEPIGGRTGPHVIKEAVREQEQCSDCDSKLWQTRQNVS